jgi:hypothetical protein
MRVALITAVRATNRRHMRPQPGSAASTCLLVRGSIGRAGRSRRGTGRRTPAGPSDAGCAITPVSVAAASGGSGLRAAGLGADNERRRGRDGGVDGMPAGRCFTANFRARVTYRLRWESQHNSTNSYRFCFRGVAGTSASACTSALACTEAELPRPCRKS